MRFRATLLSNGKTATGIRIPPEVIAALGPSRKPAVRVTIAGHTYRSTVATRGGEFLVGVSAENRASAGVAAGDELDVDLELDTEPREVTAPPDLMGALAADARARTFFDTLTPSQKQCTWCRSSRPRQPRRASDASPRRSPCCARAASADRAGRSRLRPRCRWRWRWPRVGEVSATTSNVGPAPS